MYLILFVLENLLFWYSFNLCIIIMCIIKIKRYYIKNYLFILFNKTLGRPDINFNKTLNNLKFWNYKNNDSYY